MNMASAFLRITAFTSRERTEMIACLEEAIATGGGFILDFKLFSNKAITIVFELPVANAEQLFAALTALDLKLSSESLESLNSLKNKPVPTPNQDISGSLVVLFTHNEPDLNIPVAAVPG